jgi:hypothetical protein
VVVMQQEWTLPLKTSLSRSSALREACGRYVAKFGRALRPETMIGRFNPVIEACLADRHAQSGPVRRAPVALTRSVYRWTLSVVPQPQAFGNHS